MSRKVAVAVVLLTLAFFQLSAFRVATAEDQSAPVTLYGHAPTPDSPGSRPILNALPRWGSQQASRLREEVVFTLDRPLGGAIVMEGTVVISLWVRADSRLAGFLELYLSELTAEGLSVPISGSSLSNFPVFLDNRAHPENFGFLVNYTLSAGSRIQMHVKFSATDNVTGAYLLYDSLATPTKITISALGASDARIIFLKESGEPSSVFETVSEASNASIAARMNITDSFGLYRLSSADLRVSDTAGNTVVSYPDVLSLAKGLDDYTANVDVGLDLPQGSYMLTVDITDTNGNIQVSEEPFFVAVFYHARIRVIDSSSRPIANAELLSSTSVSSYHSLTNETGWAIVKLPSSSVLGPYQLAVSWKNFSLLPTSGRPTLIVGNDTALTMIFAAFDMNINVRLLGFDLPGARVDLISDSRILSSSTTNNSGTVTFTQIPPGNYVAEIRYFGVNSRSNINLDEPLSVTLQVPLPYQEQLPYAILPILVVTAVGLMFRRRKIYESPFAYLQVLAKGALLDSCAATIVGGSGSGKTVLMESLAHQTLGAERGCVYVTNVELPSHIRDNMRTLGMDPEDHESKGRLLFIDCYSALAGTPPKEKMAPASFTDLTSLGILITSALDKLGGATDVYFDSLTPLFNTLKSDYVFSFVQSVGARVKSQNGRFYTTVGTSLDKDTLTRIEELSDCVIETQLVDSRSGQRRRLRIKKFRGHSYEDTWTRFRIAEKQGITFYTRKPFEPFDRSNLTK